MKTFSNAKLAGAFAVALATATTMAFAATPAAASDYHQSFRDHRYTHEFGRNEQHREFGFFHRHRYEQHRHGFWFERHR